MAWVAMPPLPPSVGVDDSLYRNYLQNYASFVDSYRLSKSGVSGVDVGIVGVGELLRECSKAYGSAFGGQEGVVCVGSPVVGVDGSAAVGVDVSLGIRSGSDKLGVVADGVDRLCNCEKVDSCKTCGNRRRRQEKKKKKQKRQLFNVDWRRKDGIARAFPKEVDSSWIGRKNAENELKEAQARRQLELLKSRDVEEEKRRQRAKLLEQTERSKVNIEKAYMSLKCTGNVAELPGGGFAETVVSGGTVEGVPGLSPGSGSISPDSSASQHDYRLALKQIADKDKLIEELQLRLKGQDLNEGKALTLTSSVEKFVGGLDDDEYSLDVDPAVFYEGTDPEILASVRELEGKIYVSKSRLRTQQESC